MLRGREFQKCAGAFKRLELQGFGGSLPYPGVVTPSACYRAPKSQIAPEWLRKGAKGVLVHVDPKPVTLVQKSVALVQNRVALVQETLGRPFLQLAKSLNTFCTLSKPLWGILRFRRSVAGTRVASLDGNSRQSSESVSGVFPEIFRDFL